MTALPEVTPEYFQILVVRELRKAGFALGDAGIRRRAELAEPERGFVLELVVDLWIPGEGRRALIACRRQDGPVQRDVIDALRSALGDARADCGMVFSTTAFAPGALRAGQDAGIALLRVVDGRSAFDTSTWGPTGHYPAWLPAYLTQVVDPDGAGQLLAAGRPDLILDRVRPRPDDSHKG
jgi:hypothetical protein